MKIWSIGTNIQLYINCFQQIYNKLEGKGFTISAFENKNPNKSRYFFRTIDGEKEAFWQDDKSGKSFSVFQQILSTWLSMGLIKLEGQNKTLEKRDLLTETYQFLIKDNNLNQYLNDYFKNDLKEKINQFNFSKETIEENDFFWQYVNEAEFYFSLFIAFLYNNDLISAAEIQKWKLDNNITALENWKINNISYEILKALAIDFIYGSERNMLINTKGFEKGFDSKILIKEMKNKKNKKIRIESKARSCLEFLTWLETEHYTLKVPIYQRKYTWTKNIITHLVNDIFKTSQNNDKEAHYIGEIILHRKDISSLHEQKQISKIVDGQQRLTSLLLILRVVADIMLSKKMSPTAEIKEYFSLITGGIDNENKLTKFFRHIDGSQDFQDFRNLMLGKTHKLGNNSKFLINYKTVTAILEKYQSNQIYEFVDTLLNEIIMTVTIDEVSDEFELFENMNTYKMELEILDLIRDIIMMHIAPDVLDKKEKEILNYFDTYIMNQFVDKFNKKINFFIKAYVKLYKLKLNEHSDLLQKLKDLNKDTDLYDNFKEIVKDLISKFSNKTNKEMTFDEFKNLIDYLHRYINELCKMKCNKSLLVK